MILKLEKVLEKNIRKSQEGIKLKSPVFDGPSPKEDISSRETLTQKPSEEATQSSADVLGVTLDRIRNLLLSSSSNVFDSSGRQPWNKTLQDAASDLRQISRELDKLDSQLRTFKVV